MNLAEAATNPVVQVVLNVKWWEWVVLAVVSVACIAIDMLANRGHEAPSFKKAARLVAMFVAVGALYGVFVILMHGGDAGLLYYSAWGIEYSLSIDNVFIWVVILDTFKVPAKYRHKLLFLGVFGALILRFVFIFAGAFLMEAASGVAMPILAAFVGYSAWVAYRDDTEGEIEEKWEYRLANKFLPVKPGTNYGASFFVREQLESGKTKLWVTYLFVAVVVIELVDVMFAVDSVPAALAITTEQYLVFSSNAMAILGLRAVFFIIAPLKEKLSWLNEGLALILAWVAVKLLLAWEFSLGSLYHHEAIWHAPIWLSLVIIAVVLTAAVIMSLYWPKKEGNEWHEKPAFNAAVVLHGGASYEAELNNGLVLQTYAEVLKAVNTYDTDGDVPVYIARQRPEYVGVDRFDNPRMFSELFDEAYGEVNLAAALRRVLAELPADEPALITVISDFRIADEAELEELVDELAVSGRQVFIKLVFMTSDADGNIELPQALDDRHKGVRDKVDAVYATGYHGEPGESIGDHFGRELDDLVRLINRAGKQGAPEPVSVS